MGRSTQSLLQFLGFRSGARLPLKSEEPEGVVLRLGSTVPFYHNVSKFQQRDKTPLDVISMSSEDDARASLPLGWIYLRLVLLLSDRGKSKFATGEHETRSQYERYHSTFHRTLRTRQVALGQTEQSGYTNEKLYE